MATLHLENVVHDFDTWKAVFDKFEQFRAEKGMRSYRVARRVDDPNHVTLDMDFDSIDDATAFRAALEQIRQTPQSKQQLVSHSEIQLLELVATRTL